MRVIYGAYGFVPIFEGGSTGRNSILAWARSFGFSGFNSRIQYATARWEENYRSSDGQLSYVNYNHIIPFTEMGTTVKSQGWVFFSHRLGRNNSLGETIDVVFIDAIRLLPENEVAITRWGVERINNTQINIVRGYNQQYNLTLRNRLVNQHMRPSEAHRQTVRDMNNQAIQIILEMAFGLAG